MNKPSRVRMNGPLVAHRRGFFGGVEATGLFALYGRVRAAIDGASEPLVGAARTGRGGSDGRVRGALSGGSACQWTSSAPDSSGAASTAELSARIGSHSAAGAADGCDCALAAARCVHRLSASAARSRTGHRRRLPAVRPDLPVRAPRRREPRTAASGASGAERLHARSMRTAQCRLAQQHGHRIECLHAIPVCARRHRAIARRRGPACGPAIPGAAEAGPPRC